MTLGLEITVSEVQGLQYNLLIEIWGAAERTESILVIHSALQVHTILKEISTYAALSAYQRDFMGMHAYGTLSSKLNLLAK